MTKLHNIKVKIRYNPSENKLDFYKYEFNKSGDIRISNPCGKKAMLGDFFLKDKEAYVNDNWGCVLNMLFTFCEQENFEGDYVIRIESVLE